MQRKKIIVALIVIILLLGIFAIVLVRLIENKSINLETKDSNVITKEQNETEYINPDLNYSLFGEWNTQKESNWAYRKKFGGVSFLDYRKDTDYLRLTTDANAYLTKFQVGNIFVLINYSDVRPLKFDEACSKNIENTCILKLPEGQNKISDILDEYKFEYFHDLLSIFRSNGVNVIIKPVLSPYGGQVIYPFSYYSKTGWFWKRPDWDYGLADPRTDAMRHPTEDLLLNNSYNWFEHEAGYGQINPNLNHKTQSTNGYEDTGLGNWNVYEASDMVFNGYDTVLHSGQLNIHTPIPSLSSNPYKELLSEFYSRIESEFNKNNKDGYFLFQEPTYAHLRENIRYCYLEKDINGNIPSAKDSGIENTCLYDVDYSKAELINYNDWLLNNGKNQISKMPYPLDTQYKEFRAYNLANFLKKLSTDLKPNNSKTKILSSIFYLTPTTPDLMNKFQIKDNALEGEWIAGTGVSIKNIIEQTKPDVLVIEPLQQDKVFTLDELDKLLTELKLRLVSIDKYSDNYKIYLYSVSSNDEIIRKFKDYGFDVLFPSVAETAMGKEYSI